MTALVDFYCADHGWVCATVSSAVVTCDCGRRCEKRRLPMPNEANGGQVAYPAPNGDLAARLANGQYAPVQLIGAHKRTYLGTQILQVTGTGNPKTLTVPSAPNGEDVFADVYCEADADASTEFVRFWHGADPTASVGKKLKDDQELASAAPAALQFTQGSGTCTLRAEYFYWANPA